MIRQKFFRLILVVCILAFAMGIYIPSSAAPGANHQVLSGEITISDLNSGKFTPAVAFNSQHNEFLVIWENDVDGSNEIVASRINSTGQILGGFALTSGVKDRIQPAAAYDPVNDRYLVVWAYDYYGDQTDWDIMGRFIPWEGPVSDLTEFTISAQVRNQMNPKVAYARAPEEFLVVWANTSTEQNDYVAGRRVNAGGGFPTGGSDVMIDHADENLARPDIAHDLSRNEYLIVYDNGNDIFGSRLSWDAVRMDGGEWVIAGTGNRESGPTVASCHVFDQYLVAWQSMNNSGSMDVMARYLSGDGVQEDIFSVDPTDGEKENIRSSCDWFGRDYVLTWQTMNYAGYNSVLGRMMNPDSSDDAFELAAAGYAESRNNPAIAAGKGVALAVWEHQRDASYWDIHGRMIARSTIYLPCVFSRNVD